MLSTGKLKDLISSTPVGFKHSNDDFFSNANKTFVLHYKKLGVITDLSTLEQEQETAVDAQQIYCNVPGCALVFANVAAYQSHFNVGHRYLCAECRRALPTAHLLDLHVAERHDSYFAARVERGEALYECFLEECGQKFKTPTDRKDHCVRVHKFPGNYRFDQFCSKHTQEKSQKPEGTKDKGDSSNSSESSVTEAMDTIEGSASKIKAFSFGHPKERTFKTKTKSDHRKGKTKECNEETMCDMQSVRDALTDLQD